MTMALGTKAEEILRWGAEIGGRSNPQMGGHLHHYFPEGQSARAHQHDQSLRSVHAINAAHFSGQTLAPAERTRAARWIAGRRGCPEPTRYFAGFPSERSNGIVLFTGERITSACARHILGEEASRALRQLRVRNHE